MDFSSNEVVGGLVALGLVLKGFLEHTVYKKNGNQPACACQFRRTDMEHIDNMFERVLIKLKRDIDD